MPKYVLGFDIFDCRSIVLQEGEQKADIFLVVECCGQRFQSEIKEDHSPQFLLLNEKRIWADIELLEEEFQSAYVEFGVYTRNWFSRNYCVGTATLQLKSINERLNHVYAKKVIPLTKEGSTEAAGVITLTCYCLKENEPPPTENAVEEDAQNNPENEDLATAVCGEKVDGLTGDGRPHMIFIDIFKVDKLQEIGWGLFPNPFVTVDFAGNQVKVEGASNVERFNFNTQVRIPVKTPVYEDTILIKLWDQKLMSADVLLAQGMISFSELRNKPLPPRWFSLYGYDPNEITDEQVKEIARAGEQVAPNAFKGQLLVAGRIQCMESEEDEGYQPAHSTATRTSGEPSQVQRTLLGDVYEVCGAIGRESQVEIAVAKTTMDTKWVVASWAEAESEDENEEEDPNEISDEATSFKFAPEAGRIEALSYMFPEDRESRPLVMINIYTRGVLSAKSRIGWKTVNLHEIKRYELGNPARPVFYALNCMPFNTDQKTPASVLMCLEQHTSESVQRHNRKYVKPMPYIVRAYIFMAREIKAEHPQSFGMRVSCAGTSKLTNFKKEVRPMWMQATDMKITLNSTTPNEPPTMEPITVTLCLETPTGYKDVGKSICAYEYLRQKDSMGRWEPFKLCPQWIELQGGSHGTVICAEVLLAFELLPRAFQKELPPMLMWPAEEEEYDDDIHFCKLRKATLHFSLLGLRDLVQDQFATKTIGDGVPEVDVQVKRFSKAAAEGKKGIPKYYSMKFKYKNLIDGGDAKNKEDILHSWKTDSLGRTGCGNYEFFQANQVNIKLPDRMILEPFITVKVNTKWYVPNPLGEPIVWKEEFNGDHRRCLNSLFPCSWYDGVDPLADNLKDQENLIKREMQAGEASALAQRNFIEESSDARKLRLEEERKEQYQLALQDPKAQVKKEPEVQKNTGPDALPPQFHDYDDVTNPKGLHKGQKEKLKMCTTFNMNVWRSLNYEEGSMFSPRKGETAKAGKPGQGLETIMGKFENKQKNPACDFHFLGQPLLKDHDIIDPNQQKTDWNFEYKTCFGFVKCIFKLTDGWEAPVDLAEMMQAEEQAPDMPALEDGGGQKNGFLASVDDLFKKVGLGLGGANAEEEAKAEESAAAKAAAAPKKQEIDIDAVLQSAEYVFIPSSGEKLPLLPKNVIDNVSIDWLRKQHAAEIYAQLSTPKVSLPAIPEREGAVRRWVFRIQQKMLEPLQERPVQKELSAIGAKLAKEIELYETSKTYKQESAIPIMEELLARLLEKPKDVGLPDDDLSRCVAYADFQRAETRLVLREIDDKFNSFRVQLLVDKIRSRMNTLELLATSFNFPRELNKWAFEHKTFFEHYRERTPTRIRLRLYFVKAICIFGKAYGSADPYISFTIGNDKNSLRNMPQWGTNQPEFYRAEERDLELPHAGKCQIDLLDVGDMPLAGVVGKADGFDGLIGSTVMDLEDRWHSEYLLLKTNKGEIPRENRPLCIVQPGGRQSVTGSLNMWIEMIDSKEAADKKATPLQKPAAMEIELRFVIWTLENVKLVDGGTVAARVGITLQCEEYAGPHPLAQKTDTHHGSTGSAVFNWRIVYPKIILPTKACIINVDLYHYSLLGGDTPIGSTSLDIRKFVDKVGSSMDTMTKEHSKLRFKSSLEEDEGQNIGEVDLDMMIMPQSEANLKPAGIERSDPNENPQLMTPMEGRGWDSVLPSLAFSLPSFGFYKKVLPLIIFTLLSLVGLKYVGLL